MPQISDTKYNLFNFYSPPLLDLLPQSFKNIKGFALLCCIYWTCSGKILSFFLLSPDHSSWTYNKNVKKHFVLQVRIIDYLREPLNFALSIPLRWIGPSGNFNLLNLLMKVGNFSHAQSLILTHSPQNITDFLHCSYLSLGSTFQGHLGAQF